MEVGSIGRLLPISKKAMTTPLTPASALARGRSPFHDIHGERFIDPSPNLQYGRTET
jgi:hypothetical protein